MHADKQQALQLDFNAISSLQKMKQILFKVFVKVILDMQCLWRSRYNEPL
jgi:hypothetical protein